MDDKSILEYISQVTEINDTSLYMEDKQLDEAMALVIKIMLKPELPSVVIPDLIVQLEAMAALFSIKKTYYATIDRGKVGTEQSNRKNIYHSVSESLARISDAMKYKSRANG